MNKVPDRAKMRWEYLWKKGASSTAAILSACIALVFGGYALLLMCALPFWEEHPEHTGYGFHPELMLTCLSFWFVPAGISFFCAWCCRASVSMLVSIPYVPPVREQFSTLPAE